jgi:hypothetical protein
MDEGSVCIANITRAGRVRRAVMGVVVLGATVAACLVLPRWVAAPWPWPLVAFPPIAFGWLCVMQAAANT